MKFKDIDRKNIEQKLTEFFGKEVIADIDNGQIKSIVIGNKIKIRTNSTWEGIGILQEEIETKKVYSIHKEFEEEYEAKEFAEKHGLSVTTEEIPVIK